MNKYTAQLISDFRSWKEPLADILTSLFNGHINNYECNAVIDENQSIENLAGYLGCSVKLIKFGSELIEGSFQYHIEPHWDFILDIEGDLVNITADSDSWNWGNLGEDAKIRLVEAEEITKTIYTVIEE